MNNKLHILILEDVGAHAEMMERELHKAGVTFCARRVETRDAFADGLASFAPDLILADYSLPTFDGLSALSMVQQTCPGVPFIFVSGAIGEERAIKALKQGATDYVLKNSLSRLVPSVRRALREVAERGALRQAEAALRRAHAELEQRVKERTAELARANALLQASETRLSRILESALDAIILIDANKHITLFNKAAENVFRCSAEKAHGRSIRAFLSEKFDTLLEKNIRAMEQGKVAKQYMWSSEGLMARRSDGELFPVEATISQVEFPGRNLYTIILRDTNDLRKARGQLDRLQQQQIYLEEEIRTQYNFDEIVGASPVMQEVFENIEQVAATDATVLITGETGTGKELVARAIHNLSKRKDSVLIKANCPALPSSLIESELFGHEKGAFTGATAQRKGRFELADGGTLFLDEVGELPLDMQAKLLRVLQEQEFERIGSAKTLKVDVRVIAATNRNLEEAIQNHAFRADLFYRLNIFPIHVPLLCERKEDIPLLVEHFMDAFSRRFGKRISRIASQALECLVAYPWPGNVRELANIIERAVILCKGTTLLPEHIGLSGAVLATDPESVTLEEAERDAILKALKKTGWVVGGSKGAAKLLGLPRTTLNHRIKKLGIERPD